MRWILIACVVAGCSRDKPPPSPMRASGETSHPAMPNQIEVGSTLGGRYRIVKKLGDVGEYQVLAVVHAQIEKSYVLMTPRPGAVSGAAAALVDAAERQASRAVAGEISVDDVDATPDGTTYVVVSANEQQVKALLSGMIKLGG
jgi:hypothetical protein